MRRGALIIAHYAYNVANARKHGILVGSYHYLRSSSSIREQFLNFTRMAKVGDQDLIPMIDIEKRGSWSRRELIDSLTEFANLIQAHYGVQPMIYSTMTFYNHNLAPYFNKYPLVIIHKFLTICLVIITNLFINKQKSGLKTV